MVGGIVKNRKQARFLGEKYFTPEDPCQFGSMDKRYTSSGACTCSGCKVLISDRKKLAYKKDAENIKARSRGRYHNNKEVIAKQMKDYAEKNKSAIGAYKKEWCEKNKDRLREKNRINYLKNSDYIKRKVRERRLENRELHLARKRIYEKNRRQKYKDDPIRKCNSAMRDHIRRLIRRTGYDKQESTVEIPGYSAQELKQHLESRFTKEMNWDNYGVYWHVDHIVSISELVGCGVVDPKIINSLDNLQPLEARENFKKNASFVLGASIKVVKI